MRHEPHESHGHDVDDEHGRGARRGRSKKGRNGGEGRRGRRRRDDQGQYVDTVTEEEVLELLETVPGPVLTTTDLAEAYDMTTEGARRKLNDLCDAGFLDRRKTGRTRVYWRIDGQTNA
ncbi:hypothetical protein [Halanaeroarchaeum sulfurireducens]|nr:hypothetical protein [Halanaeroarchaeum sulfurireducens]